jgi:dGTPase
LGHDLGHGPFGHAGETVLDKLWKRNDPKQSFAHELHSLRVVDRLAFRPSMNEQGLNLSYEVRDGIVCHCGERTEQHLTPRAKPGKPLEAIRQRGLMPYTMEGCVVRMVDRVAYAGRDYEDAQSVLGKLPPLPRKVARILGNDNRSIINSLVTDLIESNLKQPGQIGFSDDVFDAFGTLYDYNRRYIYFHPQLVEYAHRAENMLAIIFDFEQRELSSRRQSEWGAVSDKDAQPVRELHRFVAKMYAQGDKPSLSQVVIDHMSLMTDRYARNFFQEVFLPKPVG